MKRRRWSKRAKCDDPLMGESIPQHQSRSLSLGIEIMNSYTLLVWSVIVYFALMFFVVSPGLGEYEFGFMFGLFVLIYGFIATPLFVVGAILRCSGRNSIKTMVLRTRGQTCVHCLYDLSQRPRTNTRCPECGQHVSRRDCVLLWCQLLRS